jgi:hypothetical protein
VERPMQADILLSIAGLVFAAPYIGLVIIAL